MSPAFGENDGTPAESASQSLQSADRVWAPIAWFDAWMMTAGSQDEALVLAACMRHSRDEQGTLVVDESTLLSSDLLISAVGSTGSQTATSRILRALNRAVRRGALVRMWVGDEAAQQTRYSMPVSSSRISSPSSERSGEAPGAHEGAPAYSLTAPSVFKAYEDGIGMLTPLVADQIQQALERHPAEQILDAIREAVRANRRSWRNVQRILQNWSGPGQEFATDVEVNHETNQRRDQEHLDPDQYRGDRHLDRARELQVRDL